MWQLHDHITLHAILVVTLHATLGEGELHLFRCEQGLNPRQALFDTLLEPRLSTLYHGLSPFDLISSARLQKPFCVFKEAPSASEGNLGTWEMGNPGTCSLEGPILLPRLI